VDGLDEGLALGVDEALELHAGFLFSDESDFSRIRDFGRRVLTYRNFVAHAFEALDELGRGTCLLRQLLQIVRELRLQIIRTKYKKLFPRTMTSARKLK